MEKLLEQATALVESLIEKNTQVDELAIELGKRQGRQDARQVELDNFQVELLQRENNVKPIENISETQRLATQSKAEADLEWAKIRGEWDKLDQRKAQAAEEIRIGKADIEDKKALYNRGAEENKVAKEKLDKKLKAIQELKVG